MTFYLLAAALCLSMWFLVLCAGSLITRAGWRVCRPWLASLTARSPRRSAAFFFSIRFLPVLFSSIIATGFALPAFLKFEPRSTGEAVGTKLLVMASLGALVLLAMAIRGVRLLQATAAIRKQWRQNAQEMRIPGCNLPVYAVDGPRALLSVTGVLRPTVFVARSLIEVLSPEEFSAALSHEMAHVRSLDNLKQLFLKMTRPPRWLEQLLAMNEDAGWTTASELAADEDALDRGASALDLSAALVKVGRLTRWAGAGPGMIASHFIPEGFDSSVQMRVAHLQRRLADAPRRKNPRRRLPFFHLLCIVVAVLAYAGCLHVVLPRVHEALEMIVR